MKIMSYKSGDQFIYVLDDLDQPKDYTVMIAKAGIIGNFYCLTDIETGGNLGESVKVKNHLNITQEEVNEMFGPPNINNFRFLKKEVN